MHKWCMCTKIKEISKVGHYTSKRCKTCGGADPYGVSRVRRISKDKKVVTSSTATVGGVPEHVVAAYETITNLRNQVDIANEFSKKIKQQRAMWEGKFHQLKRENNALRRKIDKLTTARSNKLLGTISSLGLGGRAYNGVIRTLQKLDPSINFSTFMLKNLYDKGCSYTNLAATKGVGTATLREIHNKLTAMGLPDLPKYDEEMNRR